MVRFLRRFVPVVFAVALVFLVLTVSIGLPIYCRPFYYAHIDALDLERSGFTAEQIRTAYDQVLDYLTLPGKPFGTGNLAYSAEGAAHFADCKVLFDLNAGVLLASALCVAAILVLRRMGKVPSLRRGVFFAGAGAITVPLVVGGLAALDFERAFVIFPPHFLPGQGQLDVRSPDGPDHPCASARILPQLRHPHRRGTFGLFRGPHGHRRNQKP